LASLGHLCRFQRVSRLGSVTARHSSNGRQSNFAALNRGRNLYLAGRPSHWTLAHIVVTCCFARYIRTNVISDNPLATNASGPVTQVVILMLVSSATTIRPFIGTYTWIGLVESLSPAVGSMVPFIDSYALLLQLTQSQRHSFITIISTDYGRPM